MITWVISFPPDSPIIRYIFRTYSYHSLWAPPIAVNKENQVTSEEQVWNDYLDDLFLTGEHQLPDFHIICHTSFESLP